MQTNIVKFPGLRFHSCEKVPIVPVPGFWVPASNVLPPPDASIENAHIVSDLLKPKLSGGAKNLNIIIPVMPALAPVFSCDSKKSQIRAPLKQIESPYSPIHSEAYRSGRRSCIVASSTSQGEWSIAEGPNGENYYPDPNGDILIRVKGCGMWITSDPTPFPGFTTLETTTDHFPDLEVHEVRGVAFPTNASSEMYASRLISQTFEKISLLSGNYPLGFWIYDNLQNDPTPSISKCAAIFLTHGDRRLESHLLTGLEKLLTIKFNQKTVGKSLESVKSLYNFELPSDTNRTYSRVSKLKFNAISNFILNKQLDFSYGEIPSLTQDNVKSCGFVPSEDIYNVLSDDVRTFAKLFGRIGWEVGRCISLVHRTGFLWGTYVDHMQSEEHCNAHCDNLIILSESDARRQNGGYQLLAPVDFDMSFSKESAVNFWLDDKCVPDPTMVTHIFPSEVENMLVDLAGLTASVGNTSNIPKREHPEGSLNGMLWLMRDLMVWEFLEGYKDPSAIRYKGNDIMLEDAMQLIKEALKLTENEES
ncbi:Adenylyltransferase and sulfurtransferase MOCS3-1 [Histomonas meleagridis]|uniref:Adenylyltransferase and sulfurtransferase MOCS3-1 n=1 Tax=Histomonas meleagridis TaxID=135588 RepID=UPI00355A6A44|nr:Adenylyltransferase and sulfurtransferase MOCS3-1 [Histomonas meleagridis]KAH0804633.1 Adenylyltransferase and sulfurtransferase MOCS3-1 [Histomonas meleagridis]